MDEEAFNRSIRKFLKVVGVTSQQEIEKRIREAMAAGQLQNVDQLAVHATVELEKFGTISETKGEIRFVAEPAQDGPAG
ncbi:MAG TPA: DUF6494 family protein [Rhodanobacter sp.]|jgi:hypothetical protein|nr:DUF6494 family protein [Rhodanobacter sp.]